MSEGGGSAPKNVSSDMEAPPYFLIEDSVRKPGRARKTSHGKFESLEGPERHHVKDILGNPGLEGHAGII